LIEMSSFHSFLKMRMLWGFICPCTIFISCKYTTPSKIPLQIYEK
jgi:hypothetical protein